MLRSLPRWLRWVFLVVAVLTVLGLVAWIVLNREAERRLQAEIDLVREAGAPLTLEEIEDPAIPDADNAAQIYERAFALLVDDEAHTGEDADAWFDLFQARDALDDDPLHLDEASAALLEGWLDANADALALLPAALERPACHFVMDWSAGPLEAQWPAVEPIKEVAELLRVRALAALRRGEVDAAIDSLTLGVRVADQALQPPTLHTVLVRVHVQRDLLHLAGLVLERGAPSPEALARLTAAVEAVDREGVLTRTFVFARAQAGTVYALGLAGAPSAQPPDSIVDRVLGDAVFRRDHARYLRLVRRALELADRPYFESRGEWQRLHDEAGEGSYVSVVSRMLSIPWLFLVKRWVRHEAYLDVTRLALLAEIGRRETRALPARLADLGDEAGALVDPFSGGPYLLRQEDDGAFVVYSVGENGDDDGGVEDEAGEGEPDIVFRVPLS